jgi:putative peptide-modifying radical SAM enzyme
LNERIEELPDLEETANFVLKNCRNHRENIVVFYGGEPLLNQNWIKRFIELTQENKIWYVLQTNGILLNKIDEFILKKLDYLHLSIDGYPEVHDEFRGAGTYEKVLRNYLQIRKRFDGVTLARMTATFPMEIERAVLNLINKFDYIYWQLENSPKLENLENFKRDYERGLDLLTNYWVENLEKGVVKGIVPFQIVLASLLGFGKTKGFRCGVGRELVVIDVDGTCYLCDELMEEGYKIGSIKEGFKFPTRLTNNNYQSFCMGCEFLPICGGNCFKASLKYSKKFRFYCEITKLLIQKLREKLPRIEELLSKGIIEKEAFEVDCYVEEIP